MKLDYLTFSLPYEGNIWATLPQHEIFQFKKSDEIKPNGRYKKAWRLECGATYSIPKDDDWGQKALIEMQGKHCERAREGGLNNTEIIRAMWKAKGKPSRMDCAFDTNNTAADVEHIWKAWERGAIKTKIQTATRQTKKGRKGEPENSVYFGAPDSEQRLVVYDKAKQMKLLHEAWVRVELRVYGDTAYRLAKDAVKNDLETVARQKARNMVKTRVLWFEEVLSGHDVDLTPRIDTPDLIKWLNKQVAPAIDAVPEQHPELLQQVVNWLHGRLNLLEAYQPDNEQTMNSLYEKLAQDDLDW